MANNNQKQRMHYLKKKYIIFFATFALMVLLDFCYQSIHQLDHVAA